RRKFVTLLGSVAVACPLVARAQQASKRPTVALVLFSASIDVWSSAFTEQQRELGWTAGRTVAIEYRWSEGRPERIAEIAAELVQQKVDLIVAYGGAAVTVKKLVRHRTLLRIDIDK